jgi:hypothetical protein
VPNEYQLDPGGLTDIGQQIYFSWGAADMPATIDRIDADVTALLAAAGDDEYSMPLKAALDKLTAGFHHARDNTIASLDALKADFDAVVKTGVSTDAANAEKLGIVNGQLQQSGRPTT